MGKKSKKQKKRAKVASKVDRWVAEAQLSEEELIMAGLGVMAKAVEQGQKKLFNRAMKAGRRLADLGLPSLDTAGANRQKAASDADTSSSSEPVISYQHHGGGWYSVEVAGIEIDRLQGEQPAAERAGELSGRLRRPRRSRPEEPGDRNRSRRGWLVRGQGRRRAR